MRLPDPPSPGRRTGPSVTDHTYNPATKELDVTFHHGNRYRYHDITAKQYAGLQEHESAGKYLHENIIGVNDCSRLTD